MSIYIAEGHVTSHVSVSRFPTIILRVFLRILSSRTLSSRQILSAILYSLIDLY